MSKRKIAILGGDGRFSVLAETLCEKGYECAVWETADTGLCESVRCVDWRGAVNYASAVILPLPTTTDGTVLNMVNGVEAPTLSELISAMSTNTLLLVGNAPGAVIAYAKEKGIDVEDYFVSDVFETKNALPTVEGALRLAMENLVKTVSGSSFAILGYGRIGKLLADRLVKLGGAVTVYARREESRTLAELYGCRAEPIPNIRCSDYDIVFNTIPTDTISTVVKEPAPTLLLDIAPQSKLAHSAVLRRNGIEVLEAPSLPGRFFPITAGEILSECIIKLLHKKGVFSE
ncbi:MAG: NAD(P)-binding domain-containing protein [Clostridia bacterium]|nr:NAD(P)-binding domain-containing protein [Clostridia bacterium]